MQGLVLCSRFIFSPHGENDAEQFYTYVITKQNDALIKELIKKYSLYTPLRLISSKNQQDPFDQKVVEAYWIGNELLEHVRHEELGLLIKHNGLSQTPNIDRLLFIDAQGRADERLVAHHSLFVFLSTLQLSDITTSVVEQLNNSLITWGTVHAVNTNAVTVSRAHITKGQGYMIEEDRKELINYDAAFVGPLKEGDIIAIHHSLAVCPLSLIQLAHLKRSTQRTLSVFNKLRKNY